MANFELSEKLNRAVASQDGDGANRDKIGMIRVGAFQDFVFSTVVWTKDTAHRADIRLSKRDTIVTLEAMLALVNRSY